MELLREMDTLNISKYWKPFVATYLGLGIIIYLYSWLVGKDSIFEITKLMITVGIGVGIIGVVMLGRGNVLGGDLNSRASSDSEQFKKERQTTRPQREMVQVGVVASFCLAVSGFLMVLILG